MTRHVVDDGIHNDIDTNAVALLDHVLEGAPVAGPALELVADRLVSGPPLASLDVLIWGAHLNSTETLGPQDIDTLVSDRVVTPFEQVHDGLLLVLAVGLSVVNSGRR